MVWGKRRISSHKKIDLNAQNKIQRYRIYIYIYIYIYICVCVCVCMCIAICIINCNMKENRLCLKTVLNILKITINNSVIYVTFINPVNKKQDNK
jgi:hypothetical protein